MNCSFAVGRLATAAISRLLSTATCRSAAAALSILAMSLFNVSCQDTNLNDGPSFVAENVAVVIVDPCPPPDVGAFPIVINEIVLQNTTHMDEFGDVPQAYIELYNPTDEAVNISGAHLTDNSEIEDKWEVPCIGGAEIPAFGYFLIYLDSDEEDPEGEEDFHANFTPATSGFLTLILNGGSDLVSFKADQIGVDEAWGRFPDGSTEFSVLLEPTPGAANIGEVVVEFVRGDLDGDDDVDQEDLDMYLDTEQDLKAHACQDALDVNDDGVIDISDRSYLARALAGEGPGIPNPYPSPGPDPTSDDLEECKE